MAFPEFPRIIRCPTFTAGRKDQLVEEIGRLCPLPPFSSSFCGCLRIIPIIRCVPPINDALGLTARLISENMVHFSWGMYRNRDPLVVSVMCPPPNESRCSDNHTNQSVCAVPLATKCATRQNVHAAKERNTRKPGLLVARSSGNSITSAPRRTVPVEVPCSRSIVSRDYMYSLPEGRLAARGRDSGNWFRPPVTAPIKSELRSEFETRIKIS